MNNVSPAFAGRLWAVFLHSREEGRAVSHPPTGQKQGGVLTVCSDPVGGQGLRTEQRSFMETAHGVKKDKNPATLQAPRLPQLERALGMCLRVCHGPKIFQDSSE